MKSQKGITAISLVIYVISFLTITIIIGTINTFFYNNIQTMDSSASSSSEYNKFNLYMLNETKKAGIKIGDYESDSTDEKDDGNYISFTTSDGQAINTFKKLGNILYYNKIKLCEDVNGFQIKVDSLTTGKTTVTILLIIGQNSYSTEYVISR